MVEAEHRRTGLARSQIMSQVLVDRRPALALRPGRVILCPYVDNANIIAYSAIEAHNALIALEHELDEK
eukprot:6478401-Amphidinium_carterae.1